MHRKIFVPVVLSLVVMSAGWSYLMADETTTCPSKAHSEVVAPAVPQPATESTNVKKDSTLPDQSVVPKHDETVVPKSDVEKAAPVKGDELAMGEESQSQDMMRSDTMMHSDSMSGNVSKDEAVVEPAQDLVVPQPAEVQDEVIDVDVNVPAVDEVEVEMEDPTPGMDEGYLSDAGDVVPSTHDVKSTDVQKDADSHVKDVHHYDKNVHHHHHDAGVHKEGHDHAVPAPDSTKEPVVHPDGTLAEADASATMVPPIDIVKKPSDEKVPHPSLPTCTEVGQENCIAPDVVPAPAKEDKLLAQAAVQEAPVHENVPASAGEPVVPAEHPAEPVITPAPAGKTIEQTGVSKEPGQAGLYMDRLKKFTVQFPENWEVRPGMAGMDVVGISPLEGPNDTFRENVNVASQVLQSPIKMEEFYAQGKKALSEQLPNFKEIGVGDITVNGLPVHWIEFSQTSNNLQANIKQFYILSKDGNRAFIITGASAPEKFDTFKTSMDKIVQSFKVEN